MRGVRRGGKSELKQTVRGDKRVQLDGHFFRVSTALDGTERQMPTIAYFLGIAVAMYYRDHNPPHVHVIYQGYEALIAIENGRILRGKLPPTALLIIRRWVTLRRDALLDNWARAREHRALERIAGPDDDAD
jgi:hypothetical protein